MGLVTELVDSIYVNWAVDPERLPTPPSPLELDSAQIEGELHAFVTLVLFAQRDLHFGRLRWPALSFPQCNLRLPVRDRDRIPAHWLLHQLVPAWVVPLGRWIGRQPVSGAILRRDEGEDAAGRTEWRWEIAAGERLALRARPAAPSAPSGLGDWRRTVAFFRERPRAFVLSGGGMQRLDAAIGRAEAVPLDVDFESIDWLRARLPEVDFDAWSRPHSAFLVPSTRLEISSSAVTAEPVAERLPAAGVPA